jgi:superfamily II DNA or RNA helicase
MAEYKTYLNNNGYNVALRYLTAKQIKKIETDLTVAPRIRKATPEEIRAAEFPLYNYSDEGDSIIIPRYYGISRFGNPEHTDFEEAEEIDIEFTKALRPKQQDVVDLCIRYMLKNGGGLLSVPCGFGKTVCALYIAAAMGLKTLVVVHKSFLLNQWIERAVEFLNIRRENIGVIRQSKCDIVGKDLVIGVIHTMSKRPYNEMYRQFGLVIFDEAHHVGARYFSRTLMKTSCNYTLSLTATPHRNDGLIKVMYWFTGGTIYRESKKMNCNVIVKSILHTSSDEDLFRNKIKWFKGDFVSNSQQMTYDVMEIESRNQMIVNMVNHIRRKYPERNILILSEKIDHLKLLKGEVDRSIQEDIDAGLIEEGDVTSCYYIGDSKPHERQEAEENGDIIFASYQLASEGLDIKHLNTLIFASPKKDVVQTVGRIMRKILQVGDVRPLIIDIQDDLDIFNNWANIRKDYYKRCKYQIENYYMVDDQFVTGNKYYGIDSIEDNDRERHSKSMEIHKMINNRNYEYQEWKNKIMEFEDLCSKFENAGKIAKLEKVRRNRKIMNSKAGKNIRKMKSKMFEGASNNSDISESSSESEVSVTDNLYLDLTPEDIARRYGLEEFEQNNNLQVLEDFEPYKIEDILHVDRLTVTDFTRTVLKSAEADDKLDLDGDMKLDPEMDDFDDEMMKYRGKSEAAILREKLKKKRLV